MRTTFLGPTGLRVSELCLGTMTFGTDWGWGADKATSRRILDAFADAGGNFLDTADVYTNGTSEAILGELLAGRRDHWVVGTKYSIATGAGPNAQGNQRKNLVRSLDASLARLRTDYVDVLWVHVWDGFTPVEETLRALDDAVRAGKVLHVGLSDFPAWLVSRADAIADLRGLTRPAAIQVEYNLAAREAERELLPMAEALGLSVLDWSPLGGGVLTGKHLDGAGGSDGDAGEVVRADAVAHFAGYRTARVEAITRTLVEIAGELGASPAQLAIAWLRHRSPAHIPVIGARSVRHVEDNLAAVRLEIPGEAMRRLDEASRIALGFPLDFLRAGREGWFGGEPDRLDPRVRTDGRRAIGLPA